MTMKAIVMFRGDLSTGRPAQHLLFMKPSASFVDPFVAGSVTLRRPFDIDPIEQVFQDPFVDDHASSSFLEGRGNTECASVEPLVEHTESGTVKEEHLERILSTPKEYKQGAANEYSRPTTNWVTGLPLVLYSETRRSHNALSAMPQS